jgi:hypothetical protein
MHEPKTERRTPGSFRFVARVKPGCTGNTVFEILRVLVFGIAQETVDIAIPFGTT